MKKVCWGQTLWVFSKVSGFPQAVLLAGAKIFSKSDPLIEKGCFEVKNIGFQTNQVPHKRRSLQGAKLFSTTGPLNRK